MSEEKLAAINTILYEADVFGTNCKENTGMDDEYYSIAIEIVEDEVSTLEEFYASMDFWQYAGFTESMGGKKVFEAIEAIL